LYSGHYELALFPFINGFDPDVRDQFSCEAIPPSGFNKPRYCNPQLDVLMSSATQDYNRTKRTQIYHVIQRVLADDLPMLAMYQAVSINTFPSNLSGPTEAITTPFWNVGAWKLSR
jgi:ABC-type transport system substrate-binding protein